MRVSTSKPRSWLSTIEPVHGIVSREQLRKAGLSTSAIDRRIECGDLVVIHKGIYLVAAHALTWRSRVVAATLAGDGPASHRCAGAVWNLNGFNEGIIEVTTMRRPRTTSTVWHRRELGACDVTAIDGIRVTSIHRTLIDLGDVVDQSVVEDAVDSALSRKLTSAEWLQRQLERIGTNGRMGARLLADILNEGDARPASWLERRFIRLLGDATLPAYRREWPVLEYRLDFAWPEVTLAVEVHGEKWHRKRLRWAKDLERHNRLTALGWTVLHYTWDEIKNNPDRVIHEIVSTYVALTRRLDPQPR